MILLDTNVIAALMRSPIDPAVAGYLQAQPLDTLFTASLCEAEIRYGIAHLAPGRRRETLTAAFEIFVAEGFAGRIIAFDSACAVGYAEIRVRREAGGLPVAIPDAMIAGTALAYGAAVATRNVSDFAHCGIAVQNPWDLA